MSAVELLAATLLVAGAVFTFVASVGVVRMPDTATRLTATSKASPFGIGLLLAGAALLSGDLGFVLQAAVIAAFLTMTAPVAAHAVARSCLPTTPTEPSDDERAD